MPSGSALSLAGEARQPQKRPLTPAARSAPLASSAPGAARVTAARGGERPELAAQGAAQLAPPADLPLARVAVCGELVEARPGLGQLLLHPLTLGAPVALGQLEPLDLRPGPSPLGLEDDRARLGVGERGTRARELGLCRRPRRLGGARLRDGLLQALVTAGLAALERSGQLGRLPLGRRERGGERLGSAGGPPGG